MNKKVFIKQDGTIPGHRIIEELERRGGMKSSSIFCWRNFKDMFFYIHEGSITSWFDCGGNAKFPLEGYTELLYNSETDTFYQKDSNFQNIEKVFQSGWLPVLHENGMTFEYPIPDGYEAKIEDGKVIVSKKRWKPKEGENFFYPYYSFDWSTKEVFKITIDRWCSNYPPFKLLKNTGRVFQTKEEAQAFCDKLNDAIKPIIEERRKEVEG